MKNLILIICLLVTASCQKAKTSVSETLPLNSSPSLTVMKSGCYLSLTKNNDSADESFFDFIYSWNFTDTLDKCKNARGDLLIKFLAFNSQHTNGILHGYRLKFIDTQGLTQDCHIDTTSAPVYKFSDFPVAFIKAGDEQRFTNNEDFTDFNVFLDSALPLICDK